MAFRDCLSGAVEAGDITREEAAALLGDFEGKFAQKRLQLGDDGAAQAAKDELARELRAQAIEKKRRAVLTEKARGRLKDRILGYRDEKGRPDVFEAAMQVLSHYGYAGGESVRGRSEAIVSMAHGKLTDLMTAVQRGLVTGRRSASAGLIRDIVRELHGEASGSEAAKGFARSIGDVFEDLRNRFNAAGGAIPKLDGFGLPHSHDGVKVRAAGREEWKATIRPLIDADKMLHPLTGEPVGAAGIDKALDYAFDTITTSGWAHVSPSMQPHGRGALASQRQEHRFLTFKSADDWLSYNNAFGAGDPVQAMFRHINGMAKDISLMEVLGPNPSNMLEWMKQGVRSEIAKGDVGRASLAKIAGAAAKWARGTEPGSFAAWRLDGVFAEMTGQNAVASGVSQSVDTLRNIANSALLGSAGVTAIATDPFIAQASRRLAGLPVMKDVGAILSMVKASNREEIVRAGVIWDDYLHAIDGEARFAGPMMGHHWSQYLVDRSMMLFGLKPLTTGRKLVEARAWQSSLGGISEYTWKDIPERLRVTMEGFGIDAGDWDIMRASRDPAGFITPTSIAEAGGSVRYVDTTKGALADPDAAAEMTALRHREVAEKLAELTASWSERAVPGGTPNARSMVASQRGTVLGEFAHMGLQFKSFGLSFTTLQLEAMQRISAMQSGGRMSAAGYGMAMVSTLAIGGAVSMQLKNLADGKDLEDMGPENKQFWVRAMFTGGGFGLFGDFVNGSTSRFGQTFPEAAIGPSLAMLGDAAALTIGNAKELASGDKTNTPREAINFAGRYTPVLASWWATRGAYRRLFLDQLQWMADPGADRSFKSKASNLKRQTGQQYFWPPGVALPTRSPRFSPPPEPAEAN